MRSILSLLIVAAIAAMAPGQSIDGPGEVDVCQPAWFTVTGVPADTATTKSSIMFFPTTGLLVDGSKIVPGTRCCGSRQPARIR